ncbi:MAG: EVE domain-containing protein [Gemmatimonadota bacterium]|nr:EVE domain-containing protein [Gemmatimonadota bacterium]
MPAHWLLKTEPSTYSFDRLLKEGSAVWDGVRNNLALTYLRQMKAGDRVLIYHSGAEKAVVGQARIARAAYPDPAQDDPKLVVVDVAPEARLPKALTLAAIKADPALAELPLVRMSRLSVMPVTAEQWKRLQALAAG